MNHPTPTSLQAVTVIVVTYNSAHCLAALHPLLRHCPHIIVSDNGSGDGTAAQVQVLWPQATVLAHGRNLGFGTANNRALAQVQTPFALLLNPDCEMSVAQLQQILAAADQFPEAALLAPQLVDAQGQPEVNYRWPSTHWASKGPAASGPASVGFVCGAAMLMRMSACHPTGFFDETFFLYYEDDDLCLRFFQARLPMVIIPQVQALHRSRGSVKGKSPWRSEYWRGYHHAQSKLTFVAKHFGGLQVAKKRRRLIGVTMLALCIRVLLPSPKHVARMVGRFSGLLHYQNPFS